MYFSILKSLVIVSQDFFALFTVYRLPKKKTQSKIAHGMELMKTIRFLGRVFQKQRPLIPITKIFCLKSWRAFRILTRHRLLKHTMQQLLLNNGLYCGATQTFL